VIHILATVCIEDYAKFISVFTSNGKEARQRHGCRWTQVYSSIEPNQVVLLFDWSSRADFDGFLADSAVKETMKESGTVGPPSFQFLDKIGELPG